MSYRLVKCSHSFLAVGTPLTRIFENLLSDLEYSCNSQRIYFYVRKFVCEMCVCSCVCVNLDLWLSLNTECVILSFSQEERCIPLNLPNFSYVWVRTYVSPKETLQILLSMYLFLLIIIFTGNRDSFVLWTDGCSQIHYVCRVGMVFLKYSCECGGPLVIFSY